MPGAVEDFVRRGDPDRYLSARAAPLELRSGLLSLYAFNLEVSRAPWAASDSGIAAIRLQWWRDAVLKIEAGGSIPGHEVCESLRVAVVEAGLPAKPLLKIIEAKFTDIHGLEPDARAIGSYVDSTSANLMWMAALTLGAPRSCESAVREFGWGAGVASLLAAEPRLAERGRALFYRRPDLVRELAAAAQAKIASARLSRRRIPRLAAAALLAGWRAERALGMAAADPGKVDRGELVESEFRRRATLAWRAWTGNW